MPQSHISFFTNVGKTQIKETDTHFNIEGVPVTVDDAVMNNILYSAENNRAGMPTIRDRVVTLSHPTQSNGKGADAYAGESLQKFYSGGHIETVYADNGVWKVNISIDKQILKAQDVKQNSDFYSRLESKKDIGVSTGLYTEIEDSPGTNAKGEEYQGVATNQQYNHLAMLESSEPPAGGSATFMRFNSDQEKDVTINLADYMPDSIPQDNPDVEVEVEIEQEDEFNSLLTKLLALIGVGKLASNKKPQQPTEVNAMPDIKDKMAKLKAANMYKDGMSDEEVSNAYETMMKKDNAQESDKGAAQNSELITAINALTAKVEGLETKLNAKDNERKDALIGELKGLDTGITENGLKALPADDLEALYNKATSQTFSLNGQFKPASNKADDDYSDSFLNVEVK